MHIMHTHVCELVLLLFITEFGYVYCVLNYLYGFIYLNEILYACSFIYYFILFPLNIRAIGDTLGHQIGIISEPDFMEVNINDDEDVLVLICSDGVWEFISSEEAVNMIYEYGYDKVVEMEKKSFSFLKLLICIQFSLIACICFQNVFFSYERFKMLRRT